MKNYAQENIKTHKREIAKAKIIICIYFFGLIATSVMFFPLISMGVVGLVSVKVLIGALICFIAFSWGFYKLSGYCNIDTIMSLKKDLEEAKNTINQLSEDRYNKAVDYFSSEEFKKKLFLAYCDVIENTKPKAKYITNTNNKSCDMPEFQQMVNEKYRELLTYDGFEFGQGLVYGNSVLIYYNGHIIAGIPFWDEIAPEDGCSKFSDEYFKGLIAQAGLIKNNPEAKEKYISYANKVQSFKEKM